MGNYNQEESIHFKFKDSIRKNEEEFLELEKKKKYYEEKKNILNEASKRLNSYVEKYREIYAGTDELIKLNRFDQELYEEEVKTKRLLAKERDAINAEEKRLYERQESIHKKYRSELNAYHQKGEN